MQNSKDKTKYYYKHPEYACYTCIVNSLNEDVDIDTLSSSLLKGYYASLAREKYDLDKITTMLNYSTTK